MSGRALGRRAYLSLGSNLGDRAHFLSLGLDEFATAGTRRWSRVYETEPVGNVPQDDFWNLVLEVVGEESPESLLERARRAESRAGRVRDVRWGPRTLDVDLLLVGDERRDSAELTIPHPRLYERAFVLVPLRELAPELVSRDAVARGVGRVRSLGTLEELR